MTAAVRAPEDFAWAVADRLRTCVCAGLEQALGGKPALCAIVAGRDVAADDCCSGQAYLRIVRVFRTSPDEFPQPTEITVDELCDGEGWWAVELGAGVIRCAPSIDDQGNTPTGRELEQAARVQADDRGRLRRAVVCCLPRQVEDLWVGEWAPIGPEGGCVGGEQTVIVLVQAGCGCTNDGGGE